MQDQPTPVVHEFIKIYCQKCGRHHDVRLDCGFRFCPECSLPRASRIRRRLKFLLDRYPPPPGQSLKMITLSTKNCQDLGLGIRHLVRSFRKLRQQAFWKKHCSGGATIIEITGKKGDWHPHMHILCYCDFFPWKQLHAKWRSVSRGLGCYISAIPKDLALSYITKYVTKCDVPGADLRSVSSEIRKYRLFQRFGTWHNFIIPKAKSDFPCPSCGYTGWLSEWDIRKIERAFDSS